MEMANLLQLQQGSKSYGQKRLFDEAQFSINEGEHVGVIGPNGAGKTTLFKILTGLESLDSGTLVKAKNLRLGYLAQHDEWGPEETIEEYLTEGCQMPLWEMKALGHGLGISDELYSRPIASLSGGYRMRCKLLYLIGQEPNLMLLDEPTNYLDLETTLVLEKFLQGYRGAFLLISHDREFLRRTTDHVLEVEQGDITKYNGNLDDYFEQKELLRTQLETRALSLKEKRQEVMDFVSRFGAKASKARQAQSRLKSLAKMETIELKALPVTATIKIPRPVRSGKVIVSMKECDLGYGEKVVLKKVNYILHNGDHIAVVGLNGAGKSTFLKALAHVMAPLKGQIETGYQVQIGYYAQHVAENLDPNSTVIDEMTKKAHVEVSRQDGLNMAGSLLFGGDDIKKKISVLSGGEKSRVALGQILLQKAPCLILDEPTNHLDFQTVEALTQALMSYEGTVAVVSHDRSFIRRVGTKILEINHGQVNVYPGTYDEYVWSLEKGALSERPNEVPLPWPQENAKISTESAPNIREIRKNLDKELKQVEKTLSEVDKNLTAQQQKLSLLNEQIAQRTQGNLPDAIRELSKIQSRIETLEEQWLSVGEKKDEILLALGKLKT
jgi:ATP-binding cassette subfamily F protein 3